jgi:polyisoprenoid-binding protein YceI
MARWVADPDHSVAAFIIKHMMVANVRGQFNKISAELSFDPADISHSSVEAVIDASGIYTGIQKRDDHLRSPDFFDVAEYPLITFKSNKAETSGERHFKITGDLTIHGITRPVTLDAEYSGIEKSSDGDISIGFTASTRINREDYGLTWNVELESRGVMVGKEVQIFLDIEADLKIEE